MTLKERIDVLARLGSHLLQEDDYLEAVMKRTEYNNGWFTVAQQQASISAIARQFLDRAALEAWASPYELEPATPQTVGIVMAGNIPLVGFHDWLSVFVAGHRAVVKLSEKDQFLFPYLMKVLQQLDSRTAGYVKLANRLEGFDAVIATGSNNAARYFEAYFGKYPHIIRRNRNAAAVLSGSETPEELNALGQDVFQYYGLGCRNVSKVYVPKGYDFGPLLQALHNYREVVLNTKYKNNFDYNYALHLLNNEPFRANGCIMLLENPQLHSRIACLHYEYFETIDEVEKDLQARKGELQCVVARPGLLQRPAFAFGKAQQPSLTDYPDDVNLLEFLAQLS
ncbi:acyl-CoA reductase [Phaeodactylibacter luteus]|uniref:Acyl-CoA reductase n=2 Tax=Phaeodactylibacter luteus TaxID=1564516 RepID=A0A5C6RFN9_9BACT|nr:acyl-CoA reductase [Phaeodactylibacter luteus]